jgi:cytochrome P450
MRQKWRVNTMSITLQSSGAPFLDVLDPTLEYESDEVSRAREQSWFATTPLGIVVLRHREGDEILRDRRFELGGERFLDKLGVTGGPLYDMWMAALFSVPVRDHARLRGLVNRSFVPGVLERLRPFIRGLADRLAGGIPIGRDCEFVTAFADPFAALVMCEMLGVPPEDYDEFHRCSNDVALALSRNVDGLLPRIEAAIVALSEYVRSLLSDRRRHLGDDLISSLILAEQDGDRLTEDELHSLVLQLVWTGQDTVALQLGRGLVALAQHPDQWRLLAEQPELAPRAVEEIVRWTPQSRSPMRYPINDLVYRDLALPAGTMVLISTVSAQRDPRAFTDPERLDIAAVRKTRLLAFGGGIHSCLGAAAARMEMAEALLALTRRLGPPSIAGEVVWRPPMARIHGPDVLPVRFASP